MSPRDHSPLRRWYQHRKTRFRFNEANPTHTWSEFSISTKLYNNLCYAYAGIERKDPFVDMHDATRSITFVIANTRRWITWIGAQLVVYVGTIPMSRILVVQIYFVFNRPHPLCGSRGWTLKLTGVSRIELKPSSWRFCLCWNFLIKEIDGNIR